MSLSYELPFKNSESMEWPEAKWDKSAKKSRCSRGTRRNKSGVCVTKSAIARSKSARRHARSARARSKAARPRKRCPNGSRKYRNGCRTNSARAAMRRFKTLPL